MKTPSPHSIANFTAGELHVEILPSGRTMRIRPGYMTQAMVLQRTGWTRSFLLSLVNSKQLVRARRNEQGYALYLEEDIDELMKVVRANADTRARAQKFLPATVANAAAYTAEEGVKVFNLLEEKKSFNAIVRETNLHPTVLMSIVRDWEYLTQVIIIPRPLVEELNTLPFDCDMPITSARKLVDAIKDLFVEKKCANCKQKKCARICMRCAQELIREKIANEQYAARKAAKAAAEGST